MVIGKISELAISKVSKEEEIIIPKFFIPKQFSSFSMNINVANNFLLSYGTNAIFRVELGPHVAHVLNISSFNDMESEVLFNPSTQFEYIDKGMYKLNEKNDLTVYHLRANDNNLL